MTITVKALAKSVSPDGHVLFTAQARYPRFIHAEVMTHRVFSRNASSSRAVPVERMIREVENDPAYPVEWGRNQPGMQSAGGHDAEVIVGFGSDDYIWGTPREAWGVARDNAVRMAWEFERAGYHKQVVNRLLEPFSHISVIITATEWDNFFQLRDHPDADPTMQALAKALRKAMDEAPARPLASGDWHLPYADGENDVLAPRISAARAARVSYLNHDGTQPDQDKDLRLAGRLLTARHMSPFEHQATPAAGRHGPLTGWKSYRTMLEQGEWA